MTARAAACVYACVFMFRLCYGLVTTSEWDPWVAGKQRGEAIFFLVRQRLGGLEVEPRMATGEASEKPDLACRLHFPPPRTPDCSARQRQ